MRQEGQFLAFIYLYCNLNHREPAQLDLLQYFRVTPPSVHSVIVNLEQLGLIKKYLPPNGEIKSFLGRSAVHCTADPEVGANVEPIKRQVE